MYMKKKVAKDNGPCDLYCLDDIVVYIVLNHNRGVTGFYCCGSLERINGLVVLSID